MSQFYAIGRWIGVPAGDYKLRVTAKEQGSASTPIYATIHFDHNPYDAAYRAAHDAAFPPNWPAMLAKGVELNLTISPQWRYQTWGEIFDVVPPNVGAPPWPKREVSFALIDAAGNVVPLAQNTNATAILEMGQHGEIDLRITSA